MLLFSVLGLLMPAAAPADEAPDPSAEIKELISKMEARTNGWIAFRSPIAMEFTSGAQTGACRGEALYDRFRDRLKITCSDDRGKLLFAFRSTDQNFELYLKRASSVYRGNIFALEHSPDIESHLSPLALYRSLKFCAVPAEQAEIEAQSAHGTALQVWSDPGDARYVLRRITADPDGNVPEETWYHPDGVLAAHILRSDYRPLKDSDRLSDAPVYLPHRIELRTRKDGFAPEKITLLTFQSIDLLPGVDEKDWQSLWPDSTRIVELQS